MGTFLWPGKRLACVFFILDFGSLNRLLQKAWDHSILTFRLHFWDVAHVRMDRIFPIRVLL